MEHYRRTAHTRFDIKLHLVWITKYRKKLLRGDVGLRLRQIVRTICAELEVEILKGHVTRGSRSLVRFVSPARIGKLSNAKSKGKEFAAALARVQPPKQGVLGPTSLGSGILRGEFR